MMRRIVVMAFGFVLAVGVAAIFLIVSALLDPATREAGFAAATSGLFAFVEEDVRAGGWSDPLATFGFIIWSIDHRHLRRAPRGRGVDRRDRRRTLAPLVFGRERDARRRVAVDRPRRDGT